MGFGEEEFGGEGFGFGFEEEDASAVEPPPAPPAQQAQVAAEPAQAQPEPQLELQSEPQPEPSDSVGAAQSSVGNISQDIGHEQDVRTEKSGWLKVVEAKKTLSRRGPKERWFTLGEGKLIYAPSVRADPIATYPLTAITHVQEGGSGQEETFTIVTAKKTLAVVAKDEADAKLWIACIRKAQKSNTDAAFGTGATGNALLF